MKTYDGIEARLEDRGAKQKPSAEGG